MDCGFFLALPEVSGGNENPFQKKDSFFSYKKRATPDHSGEAPLFI
nr:hypothetical protein [uncultured Flavobacterium sp.]